MVDEDFEIVGLDEGVLGRVAEEIVGMANDELVKRGGGSDQHGTGAAAATSRATGALPGGGDRAGIACHHNGVERADIDPQFQGAGGDYAADAAVAQAALDFTPLAGEISPAVAADGFRFSRKLRIRLL